MRLYTFQIDRFQLALALKRLRSPFVERQLNGLDYLTHEATSTARRNELTSKVGVINHAFRSLFIPFFVPHLAR
jgi:hypothetical protein